MSRTDKDDPWWLNAPWVEHHSYSCTTGDRDCNLPAGPPKRPPIRRRQWRDVDPLVPERGSWMIACHWRPINPRGRHWCGCWYCDAARFYDRTAEKRRWRQEIEGWRRENSWTR